MNRQAIDQLLPLLTRDLHTGGLTTASVGAHLTEAVGGTDAAGAWTWRQAYDLVQSAAILADRDVPPASDPAARLAMLTAGAGARPTETRRSEVQIRLQQFSTPLPYAYVAAFAAAIRPGDVALEPSAGTGALAHMAALRRGEARAERDRPVPRRAPRRDVRARALPARRRAHRRPARSPARRGRGGDEPAVLVVGIARSRPDHRAAPCGVGGQAPRSWRTAGGDPADGGLCRSSARALAAARRRRHAAPASRPARHRLPQDGDERGDRAAGGRRAGGG